MLPTALAALSPQQKLLLAALLLATAMAGASLVDPKGLQRLRRLEADIARQELKNRELREENARLSRTVKDLSPPLNPAALQRAAREQLGFVRPDEVLFKFE
jgi:cell division protein FtsB